ncbi:unnamed protein product [Somion occarium]|uniref:Structural maintenance of chromosomes protein 5 n=1 Tax=Somion occarium TaxID=3059160 RepID=A0ABP1CWB9_9APHY
MVRRALSDATDDSLKENSRRAPVSAQKPTKMRRETLRDKRVRRAEDDEDVADDAHLNGHDEARDVQGGNEDGAEGEIEDEDEADDEDTGGSPKGRKRARANTIGDSHPTDGNVKGKQKAVTLPRDVDGYAMHSELSLQHLTIHDPRFIPGSIMRIQLRNFVTYDYVEFFPGPHLNMILGPNGTGKSSIACAICLGLNFPPSVLGRASELSAFVKLGTSDGHIEIELKGPKGKPNLVIRRTLSATSKSSQFILNGHAMSGREVNQRMAELNVQVSNLCSFLPQDKVAEFARMSPQQLLRETQRAAGNENLTAWHDTLITAGKELKHLETTLTADREQLKTLQERNANLERDVKRYEERRAIEKEIELLELMLPFVEYTEAKRKYDQLKAAQTEMHEKVKKLNESNAPYINLTKKMDKQLKDLQDLREKKKSATQQKFASMKRKWQENLTLEGQAEELKNELDNLKTREKNRLKEIQKSEKTVENLQKNIDNPPKIEDVEAIKEQLKQLRAESRDVTERQGDLQERQRTCIEEESRHKMELENARRNLRQLDDVNSRRLKELEKVDKDAADVVQWLRQNRHRFRMDIIEPPILSCAVPDTKFATAVEACFNFNDLRTFVAQCQEDATLLNRLVVDSPDALGRRVRINSWFRPRPEYADPPMSAEELRGLGFDGYASDFIQCPDGLRPFLHSTLNLHRTAIAVQAPNRVDAGRAMEVVARSGGASYIVGNTYNQVSRSRYGQQKAQNQTRDIRHARFFLFADADPAQKAAAENAIREAEFHLEGCKKQINELSVEDSKIRAEINEFSSKNNALEKRKKAAIDIKKKLETMKLKLVSEQGQLDRLRKQPSVDAERAKLKSKILKCSAQRVIVLKDYEKLAREAIASQTEASKVALEALQVAANHAQLKAMCSEREDEMQKALAEFNKVRQEYQIAKLDSRAKLDASKEKINSVDEELRARFQEMEQTGEAQKRSVEELTVELQTQQEKLELSMHTNPGVVDQYKKRQEAIAELERQIEEREEKVQKKERAIKLARDNWEPALTRLVESVGQKFSAAFDRIGCAGEIKLTPHEDYDKWAIDILVKFRDHEKLQLLTGERQSGGERSLTTIMYLMSLTEEARTPFSLVDEINQGMDARAERAVHNSLVEVTCKSDSGQYFLITPKLLADLLYHERMKVLCVNNGEWLPEETDRVGNMMRMIEGYVNHRSRASA